MQLSATLLSVTLDETRNCWASRFIFKMRGLLSLQRAFLALAGKNMKHDNARYFAETAHPEMGPLKKNKMIVWDRRLFHGGVGELHR